LQDPRTFAGWLRAIARNRSLTWRQRRGQLPRREGVDVETLASTASPAADLERREARRLVHAALARLPEAQREILVMHYMHDLPTPRLATLLGISEAAVRQRLHRGRRQMQQEVTRVMADALRDEAPGDELTRGVTALLARSRELFQRADYRAAVPVLEDAAQQESEDALVALLLADACTLACTPGDMAGDPRSCQRALELLDQVLARQPGNLLVRLRRAAVHSLSASPEEVFAEGRAAVEAARGTPFEGLALLELGRAYGTRGRHGEAQQTYAELLRTCPDMACVVHSELGVLQALRGDAAAIRHFEEAVAATTPQSMEALQRHTRELFGPLYATFWSTVDGLAVRQCQNHAWLAGLHARLGDIPRAREHLRAAVAFLEHEEVGAARPLLRRELVARLGAMFPELAAEPEVRALERGGPSGP
ncbi:MAG: sigma-70 family RNA polymerase sigma factor, partial [Candidatus Latescibacterota bacterium]